MHDTLNTRYDVLKERYIYHATLTGRFGFPQLPEVHARLRLQRHASCTANLQQIPQPGDGILYVAERVECDSVLRLGLT